MGLLADFDRLISEHGSAVVLRQHLALLRDQVQALEKELERSQKEASRLVDERDEFARQLEKESVPEKFIEHRGVLFRKQPDGKIEDTVYCPRCKSPMHSLQDVIPFTCGGCSFSAGFTGQRLHGVLKELVSH